MLASPGLKLQALALAVLLTNAGCHGVMTYHTAQPVPKGEVQFAAAVAIVDALEGGETEAAPFVEALWRYGCGRDLDVGIGTSGFVYQDLYSFQADANVVFARTEGTVWSFDPTFAALAAFDAKAQVLWLPVLVDVYTDELMTVTLAAKYGHVFLSGLPDDDLFTLDQSGDFAAFGIGVKLRIWKQLALAPEFDVLYPTWGNEHVDPLYTLGLALVWN